MEGYTRKDDKGCHQFLDLVPKERECVVKSASTSHGLSLSLGPPGVDWTITENNISQKTSREENHHGSNFLDFGCFPNSPRARNPVLRSPWQNQTKKTHNNNNNNNNLHHLAVMNESSQPSSNRVAVDLENSEKKAFLQATANTDVPNVSSAQKRTAPAPMVGWPPIRSFRKNLASGSSSKLASEEEDVIPTKVFDKIPKENCPKTLFVKINMDGVPIGRKVDLKAYDSYKKLSYAVDELFRGLLAAQSDSLGDEEGKVAGGLLGGNREYTLVYEDNEGDWMLVGDVPWHMFVSTVKRLRVLKSSELPALSPGSKQGKQLSIDASTK